MTGVQTCALPIFLAARIRAGVAVGSRIEVVGAPTGESGLCTGDRGVVDEIDERGHLQVSWDRGFVSLIDPASMPVQALAA